MPLLAFKAEGSGRDDGLSTNRHQAESELTMRSAVIDLVEGGNPIRPPTRVGPRK